jgi:UDP-N-acetylglucosamine 2-epimerase (non-hydrolysing)
LKIVTVLGTRPEIIRLSQIIPKLDQHAEHLLVHTGQNHTATLSDVFFSDLGLRQPDRHLGVEEPDFGRQIGRIMAGCHDMFQDFRPDRLLILGDTNSAMSGFVAARLGIPVFHMEAGNRCFDSRVPEEVNRRVIDQSSDVLMPYTERSRQNLLREGFASDRVFVTGNPIYEVMQANAAAIDAADVLGRLKIEAGGYFIVSLHRAENVDIPERLAEFVRAFEELANHYRLPVVVSTHPRTRSRLTAGNIGSTANNVRFMEPVGFFDFVHLEKHARCVLSDSGTVQEECAILEVPSVTLRDVTERPETLECGSNILTGGGIESILSAVGIVLSSKPRWRTPVEYLAPAVSNTVLQIVTGYFHGLQNGGFQGGRT